MKRRPLYLLPSVLVAFASAQAETVIFDEAFSGSTVMSATPAAPTATTTDYAVMSSKNATGSSLLDLNLSSGTSAGFGEIQALFTTNPVTLGSNEWITLEMTFQGTFLLDKDDGGTQTLNVGLYNSGGSYPVPGGQMANGGMGSGTSFVSGYAQDWEGYVGRIGNLNGGNSSQILTREPQTDTTDENQDVLFNNSGTGAYDTPTGQGVASGSNINLTDATDYTLVLTVRNDGTDIEVTQEIFAGVGTLGVSVYSASGTAPSGYEYDTFDSLAFGARFSAPGAPSIDVSALSVTKYTIADLPALYNLQLTGFPATTYSGAAYIGSSGDLWNNPDWVGVPTGSTNLFTDIALLESAGTDLGVTASLTAAYNNNTTDWNDGGVFNHYTSQTAGSATPILMDRLVKVDYSGSVNVMTLTVSGLPANKLATVYMYGAGNGAGQGGQWSLNGGASTIIAYDGSPTGRDVTLAGSKGISWDSLSGATDGSGNLTITATGPSGGNPWWQTYLNGIQIQVGGTAPAITGLDDQEVEEGTTVLLSPVVTGNPAPTYQWQENGTSLVGENGPTLTLTSVSTDQDGYVYGLIAENPIGVASNSMTLTVTESVFSDMTVTDVSPTNAATGICVDTLLTATFSDAVSLGTIGSVKIYDASNPGTPVDTLVVADGERQQRTFPGDGQSFTYPTFDISGNTVTLHPNFNVLDPDSTYYVTIDPKTFLDSGGTNFVGLADTNAWSFSTQSAPADPNNLTVNGDGSEDYCTVQGAVNSLPGGNTTPTIILVRDGFYEELVNISGKHNVTLRGERRAGTTVAFPNNAAYQSANGGTTHARMSFKVNADDVAVENITLRNTTPQGGTQAEALMLETGAARFILNNATVASRQDTILANVNTSQGYFYNSQIDGNFDYVWGGGNLFFTNCTIRTISGSGAWNITAARTQFGSSFGGGNNWQTPEGSKWSRNGFSFVDCRFEKDPGVGTVTVAGRNGSPGGCASWIYCQFDAGHAGPANDFDPTEYNFWQYENTDLSGASPVAFADVVTLTNGQDRLLAAVDANTWLYGWVPQLLPYILTQPAGEAVEPGADIQFTASATGIPAPTYQWTYEGGDLSGETNATLAIDGVLVGDAGDYAVVVANAAGAVTSLIATLTVMDPTPPTLSGPAVLGDGTFQFNATGSDGQAYSIWGSTDLTLTPFTNAWSLLTNGTFGTGPVNYVDPQSTNLPHRAYLIRAP